MRKKYVCQAHLAKYKIQFLSPRLISTGRQVDCITNVNCVHGWTWVTGQVPLFYLFCFRESTRLWWPFFRAWPWPQPTPGPLLSVSVPDHPAATPPGTGHTRHSLSTLATGSPFQLPSLLGMGHGHYIRKQNDAYIRDVEIECFRFLHTYQSLTELVTNTPIM
jgi:hypothetical protein